MNLKRCIGGIPVLLAVLSIATAQQDNRGKIRFTREQDVLFLSAVDVAAKLDLEFKLVTPDRLVTFCDDGDSGICIPVRLTPDNHRGNGENLLLDANLVCRALVCRLVDTDSEITIERDVAAESSEVNLAAGYNAKWPGGRGFHQGATLPDIPLVDLHGNEVRFSQFLGKRYILYCWASW